MRDALKNRFPPFPNEQSLRSAIESVSAKFGKVTSLKILPASREPNPQCVCFLRLDSDAAEKALRLELKCFEFSSEHSFSVDVEEGGSGPILRTEAAAR